MLRGLMQLGLPLRERNGWGGRRKGAGRKPKGARSMVSRKARPVLNGRHPVHATLRVLPGIPSLRVLNGRVKRALVAGAIQPGFQLIHFSIQGNHLHLIVEADDTPALSRGMKGVAMRIARAVNQAMSRKRGRVFSDRYHHHVLETPSETRAAISYLLNNYKKHMAESGRSVGRNFIDRHSTARSFAGLEESPLPTPGSFFLSRGWSLAGPIQVGPILVR